MSSPATNLSCERVKFLLHSRWPTDVNDVDGWLNNAPKGLLRNPPAGGLITPVTVNTHDGHVSSFNWFASYPDPAQLIEVHDNLGSLITALLGTPGIQERERGHSGYWVTSRLAIETYAHDVSESEGRRELKPTLQVNVADAALAAAKEALARALAASKRRPPPADRSD